MPTRAPEYTIILAAGKGTRMQSADRHKVCFPVDGVPAINRALTVYNNCGIRRHVIVVGALAGQVVETVGAATDNAMFVYQAAQLGTAHAAAVGLTAVADDEADVLLVAGDRLVEQAILEQLFDIYYSGSCDVAVLACPMTPGSTQGRIITGADGALLGIVELADICQRRAYRQVRDRLLAGESLTAAAVADILRTVFSTGRSGVTDAKVAAAFDPLWSELQSASAPDREALLAAIPEARTQLTFTAGTATLTMTPDEVDATPLANTSVYLVKAGALRYALAHLDRNNAQRERYLPDLIAVLAEAPQRGGTARALRIDDPTAILGFNDPAELLAVEAAVRARGGGGPAPLADGPWLQPIRNWRAAFAAAGGGDNGPLADELVRIYGDDTAVLQERLRAFDAVLAHAAEVLSDERTVLLVRSPGRVNVMGRHIDHQGGNCNLMTIGYETVMVVCPRDDDRVCLYNTTPERFENRSFAIGELVQALPWDDWLSLVNSEQVRNMIGVGVDWSQYVQAVVLRLQKKFTSRQLRGMDVVVSGNVPMAAGLSSSSSLVVGAAEAIVAINGLDTFPSQLVDLCGEGEWFVGTRGGSADHAAVMLGQKGKVVKVRFFEFAIEEAVTFPEDYVLAVCDSRIKAKKSTNARDQFNHRISCYRIGFLLLRRSFPEFAPLLQHLRDVNSRHLDVPLSRIYRLLLLLPEQATRTELAALLPDDDLTPFFATHEPPADGLYPIRGVVLFGLAECERARRYASCLKDGELDEIGRLMNVSHDGDRVVRHAADGTAQPYAAPTSNGYLLSLMSDLESGDPGRVIAAQLARQPGAYGCSLPEIDRMVDIALATDGVVGAQLAGAGLGGCMMVLAHRRAQEALVERLNTAYYEPAELAPQVLFCKPVAGSGVLLRSR
jgi:N-acetylgalactosamine kinase